MSDFEFKCPSCDGSLEASEDMVGMIVECPHCELRIRIPPAPEVLPSEPVPVRQPHKHVVVKKPQSSSLLPSRPTRECPFCGETILAAATKCGYCEAAVNPLVKTQRQYGGVGRLGYWVTPYVFFFVTFVVSFIFGLFAAATCGNNMMARQNLAVSFTIIWGVLACGVFIRLAVCRLVNMGLSGWYAWLFFVPFVNFGIGLACACFPEGYGDSKKLDAPAWVLMVVYIGLFAGCVFAVMQMPALAGFLKR